jgi:Putative transposase
MVAFKNRFSDKNSPVYSCTINGWVRQSYAHGGGFSVDASVRIGRHDRQGLERLLRYCAKRPCAGQRIRIDAEQIIYGCPKAPAGEQGGTSVCGKREYEIVLTPLEFIARIAALVPPPRQHRHRY